MISAKVNIKKPLMGTSLNQATKKTYVGYHQQNSIKNYLQSKPIVNKLHQLTNIDVEKCKVKEDQVNDENCSFNANIIQNNSHIIEEKFKIKNPSFIKL